MSYWRKIPLVIITRQDNAAGAAPSAEGQFRGPAGWNGSFAPSAVTAALFFAQVASDPGKTPSASSRSTDPTRTIRVSGVTGPGLYAPSGRGRMNITRTTCR